MASTSIGRSKTHENLVGMVFLLFIVLACRSVSFWNLQAHEHASMRV